jgi:hypothetical protein
MLDYSAVNFLNKGYKCGIIELVNGVKTVKSKLVSNKNQKMHRPFLIRKTIVVSAAVIGWLVAEVAANVFLGIAVYMILVPLLDAVSHYGLKLKASTFALSKDLLQSEGVTLEQLDAYFDTRRYIRFVSLAAAITAGGIAFFVALPVLKTFCLSYIATTLAGIVLVRRMSKIVRPRLFHRNDRYYKGRSDVELGNITPAQHALASSGSHHYGPVQH